MASFLTNLVPTDRQRNRNPTPGDKQQDEWEDGRPRDDKSLRPMTTAHHRTHSSSTKASVYDEPDLGATATSGPVREYGFYYTKQHRHMVVCAADAHKTPRYFAEVSEWTRHKPDVTLHAVGASARLGGAEGMVGDEAGALTVDEGTAAPVVAVAHFPLPSRNVKIGIGDPAAGGGADVVWEEMKNVKKLAHSEYRFELSGSSSSADSALLFSNDLPTSARRSYTWQRTQSAADGVEGGALRRTLNLDSYKLVTEEGAVLAVFLDNGAKSWKKKGKLRVYEAGGGEEIWRQVGVVAVLTIAAILEKARRRRSHSGGGGG